MKRTPLARTTRLQAKTAMKRGRKPLPKVNARQAKKRRARYKKFLASAVWRELRAVAIGWSHGRCARCGWQMTVDNCEERRLEVHHKTYARFGGNELVGDVEVLCTTCHRAEESLHPTRRHGRSA